MRQRNVNTMHESRMWITQIIIPLVTATVGGLLSDPDIQRGVKERTSEIVNGVKGWFKKGKDEEFEQITLDEVVGGNIYRFEKK